jgi:hypothetical protein
MEGTCSSHHAEFWSETSIQTIVEPYVYRNLCFADLGQLQRIVHSLSIPGQSERLSRWTRFIELDFNNGEPNEKVANSGVDAASAIVVHTRDLVKLSVDCHAAPNGLLAIVAVMAPATLCDLDLSWESPGMPALLFSCIGSLLKLQKLRLAPRASDQDILPRLLSLDVVAPWALHELSELVISFEECVLQTSIQLLHFLSRCLLGRPNTLCLQLTGDRFDMEYAPALEIFLRRHVALSRCSVSGHSDILSVAVLHADTTYLKLSSLPSVPAVITLSPRLRTLSITTIDSTTEPSPLRFFMTALENHHRLPQDSLRIQVHYLASEGWSRFRWTPAHDPSRKELELRGQMHLCAYRLRLRAIELLDTDGDTFDGTHIEL